MTRVAGSDFGHLQQLPGLVLCQRPAAYEAARVVEVPAAGSLRAGHELKCPPGVPVRLSVLQVRDAGLDGTELDAQVDLDSVESDVSISSVFAKRGMPLTNGRCS
ncbi:hypothetical protein GCM10017744_078220 [Streptomyces antimycoticus]|uniref:Uncharacterized protein n=1 Tax=Streptomyces antimycoticus TaxID=68175 RepID=A0A4D4K479_9ACTN|nr:hypothetical protein SANT12839_023200 [Streptomyces antimycoticus]